MAGLAQGADALLKLGYTQYAQKQNAAARATLTEVMAVPGERLRKLAAERLRRVAATPFAVRHRRADRSA